jgi:hypothetical protein
MSNQIFHEELLSEAGKGGAGREEPDSSAEAGGSGGSGNGTAAAALAGSDTSSSRLQSIPSMRRPSGFLRRSSATAGGLTSTEKIPVHRDVRTAVPRS